MFALSVGVGSEMEGLIDWECKLLTYTESGAATAPRKTCETLPNVDYVVQLDNLLQSCGRKLSDYLTAPVLLAAQKRDGEAGCKQILRALPCGAQFAATMKLPLAGASADQRCELQLVAREEEHAEICQHICLHAVADRGSEGWSGLLHS